MANKPNLVIVESPSKAKTIGKYLGPDYTVKASMGHLRDLPKSTIGVDIDRAFTPEYIPVPGKEKLIEELRQAAMVADTVYLATDPDREGEAISWHLQELLELPDHKVRRVTFNAITQKTVTEAIAQPRSIDYDLVDAQQARRVLDRVVSFLRCCGRRFDVVCLPAVCRVWLPDWLWIVKMRSAPLFPRNIGLWRLS